MAKPPKKSKPEDIETDPAGWDRFERAVDAAVKSGPRHRVSSSKIVPPKRLKSERRPVPRVLKLRRMPPDETALDAAEAELEALVGKLSPEDFADARAMLPKDLFTLFVCERKGVRTETAYELTLVFKPSQTFLDLLATLRAWEHDQEVVNGR